jgi:hypothetical protein
MDVCTFIDCLKNFKTESDPFFQFFFFYQNNNGNEVVALEKEEIQQAVNTGNLDADKEYQSKSWGILGYT